MSRNRKEEKKDTKLPDIKKPKTSSSSKSATKRLSAHKSKKSKPMSVSEEVHKALLHSRKLAEQEEQKQKEEKSALLRYGHRQILQQARHDLFNAIQRNKIAAARTDHYIKIGISHPVKRGK